ncbi:MAG: glycosyl-4,4'-diaponeurosporenoate acyltransferase [Planctomycetota bacterium]
MATSQVVTLAVVNVLAWPVIHVGFAWAGTRARAERFRPDAWLFRTRAFERTGRIYEVLFGVKAWKGRLPDGAAWFKSGFKKRSLARADRAYLDRFVVETCRGEFVHWATFLAAGIFFLWNEAWVGWIMVAYGVVANLPCIIVQRYNRVRIRQLIEQREARRDRDRS